MTTIHRQNRRFLEEIEPFNCNDTKKSRECNPERIKEILQAFLKKIKDSHGTRTAREILTGSPTALKEVLSYRLISHIEKCLPIQTDGFSMQVNDVPLQEIFSCLWMDSTISLRAAGENLNDVSKAFLSLASMTTQDQNSCSLVNEKPNVNLLYVTYVSNDMNFEDISTFAHKGLNKSYAAESMMSEISAILLSYLVGHQHPTFNTNSIPPSHEDPFIHTQIDSVFTNIDLETALDRYLASYVNGSFPPMKVAPMPLGPFCDFYKKDLNETELHQAGEDLIFYLNKTLPEMWAHVNKSSAESLINDVTCLMSDTLKHPDSRAVIATERELVDKDSITRLLSSFMFYVLLGLVNIIFCCLLYKALKSYFNQKLPEGQQPTPTESSTARP